MTARAAPENAPPIAATAPFFAMSAAGSGACWAVGACGACWLRCSVLTCSSKGCSEKSPPVPDKRNGDGRNGEGATR